MSTFNPDSFLHTQTEAVLDTKYTPVPEGEYASAYIEKVEARTINTQNGPAPQMVITWEIQDEALAQKLGRDKVFVRQNFWLDIDDNGNLESGTNKNVPLGQVREVFGQNKPGKAWSPQFLVGQGPARVKVAHRVDKNDASKTYDEVRGVAKA